MKIQKQALSNKALKKPQINFCQQLFKLAKDQGLNPLLVEGRTGIHKDSSLKIAQPGFFLIKFESAHVWVYLASK